jgi:hypothetical protein
MLANGGWDLIQRLKGQADFENTIHNFVARLWS